MHKGIFITGTDTGVGKTFVAVGLINALKEKGFNICPMKPVETGCRTKKGKLIPEDTMSLIKASGIKEAIDVINPYRFKHPLAPSVAAELERKSIKKEKIFSAYNYLSKKYDITIVEGAGGIMAPLYKKYLFLDFISDINLPIIIVSRPGLGTINHTLLTIEIAKSRGIKILGVIINYAGQIKNDISVKTNPKIIESIGGIPLVGIVPYLRSSKSHARKIFKQIAGKLIYSKRNK
ncbi:MAG TPA: dethiobiotin synthase [Thermodesulfovibrionia bacterium]|nr:dethiobiotin synthase [Thermodesulfovibrionia bacterium]